MPTSRPRRVRLDTAAVALATMLFGAACSDDDSAAPAAPRITDVQASSCEADPIVSGTAEFGATVTILGGSQEVTTVADPYTAAFAVAVPVSGTTTLSVTATDAAGNESEPTEVEVTDADLGGVPAMVDLTTTPSPATVTAGADVAYEVTVVDSCGNTLSDAVVDVTTNAPGAIAAAGNVSGLTAAGNFMLVARIPGSNAVDAESITVDADEGTAVVDLRLFANASSVGLPVSYAASIVDGFGNPVPGTATVTVPSDAGAAVDTSTNSIIFSSAGTHTVTASLGDASDSELIVINVTDFQAPSNVAITAPLAGSEFEPGDTVTVTVHAEDDVGLTQLVFQASGEASSSQMRLLPSDTTSTDQVFTFDIPGGARFGDIDLIAQAVDGAGLITSSQVVTVRVDPAAGINLIGGFVADTVTQGGLIDSPRGLAILGSDLYVANDSSDRLVRVDVATGAQANFGTVLPASPFDVVHDPSNGRFFVTGDAPSSVLRVDDTTAAANVFATPGNRGLALDGASLWALEDVDPTRVRRYSNLADSSGSATADCSVDLGTAEPPAIQEGGRFIAVNAGDLYLTDLVNDAVWMVPSIGTECGNQPMPICLASSGFVDGPEDIVVAPTSGLVYWVNRGDGTLRSVDPATCGPPSTSCGVTDCVITTIADGLNEPIGLALSAAEDQLFITERNRDTVFVITASGTF